MPDTDTMTAERLCYKAGPLENLTFKEAEPGKPPERLVTGYCSTMEVDEGGDVMIPEGVDTAYFERIKSVDLFHDPTKPIGVNRRFIVQPGKGILTTTFITDTPLGVDVFRMMRQGVLKALSIAYYPTLYGPPDQKEQERYGPNCGRVVHKWNLRAYSVVAQPMNSGCTIEEVKSWKMPDEWYAKVDAMLTKGEIHRDSAVAVGYKAAEPRAQVRKTWRLYEGGKLAVLA